MKGVPSVIDSNRDIKGQDYIIETYTEVRFPMDLTNEKFVKKIEIENSGQSSMDIYADVKFDFPFSLFNLRLSEMSTNLNEDFAIQVPLEVDNGDEYSPVLVRKISSDSLQPGSKYSLDVIDISAYKLMNWLASISSTGQICVYSEFTKDHKCLPKNV